MTGLRAVGFALLVALGALGGVAVVSTQQGPSVTVQPVENTSNYLGPNASDVDRSGQAATSLDVGATVSANAAGIRSTFSRASLEQKYENADSREARRAVVRNGTDSLAVRVDALERKEVTTIDRYASGDISERDLFRELAGIHTEATKRSGTAAWLESRAAELGMSDVVRRVGTLQLRLVPLRGPVRAEVREGLDGSDRTRVHAETAEGGLVLTTIVQAADGDHVYVREAYDAAIRDLGAEDQYGGDLGSVFFRFGEIYTWVGEQNPVTGQSNRIGIPGGPRLYTIPLQHNHGTLTPFLAGDSDRVVKETQRLQIDRLPTETRNVTGEDGDLRVRIDTTYVSGPIGVTAIDNATGQRVDASVAIDGEAVGRTRGDRVWTIEPKTAMTVTVRHGGGTVNVTTGA